MKTAVGKFWERRLDRAAEGDRGRFACLAELELGDLLDHAGPRALRNNAAHDIRLFRAIAEEARA